MNDVFLVRCETSMGEYIIVGVFRTDDDAYLFAHSIRTVSTVNIMRIEYDPLTGKVVQTRIEYL